MSKICFENQYAKIVLSEVGCVLAFTDKMHDIDILAAFNKPFCYLTMASGEKLVPDSVAVADNVLTFVFGEDELKLRCETHNEFFVFTILNEPKTEYISLRFADFEFDYDFASKNTIVVSGYAMNIKVNPVYFPGGSEKAACGECFREIGVVGGKLAIVTTPYDIHREAIKQVDALIAKGDLPITAAGGANALDFKDNHGDYVLVFDTPIENTQYWIDFYNNLSVDQVDFHQSEQTFRQGDFKFHKTGDAAGFCENIAKPFGKAGITCALHTYSFYIDYNAEGILSDPKWQQQLDVLHRLTLKSDISTTDDVIIPKEGMGSVSSVMDFMSINSPLILIDREMIYFEHSPDGFASCRRGWAGTIPAPHKEGAEIRVISGYYGMVTPVIGSELFYHIARETARTYNEGGFGMFYLDAFDGIVQHVDNSLVWYYAVSFVNEIVKHCKRSPMIEASMLLPCLWVTRGRGGALDYPHCCYKRWTDMHLEQNRTLMDRFYSTTFGWYNFYPTDELYPGNFRVKYQFSDDMDYMGTLALAYNQSIVYQGIENSRISANPALDRNIKRYLRYNRLRKSNAVSEETLKKLREGKYEWILRETQGNANFVEAKYLREKLFDLSDGRNTMTAFNPFGEQKPFIRIENRISTAQEQPFRLLEFDENRLLTEQIRTQKLNHVNIKDKLTLRVKVFGNGSDDALCISLRGSDYFFNGYSDFVIPLNFTGWRDFILCEPDNGEYADFKFEGRSNFRDVFSLAFCRDIVNYENITEISVLLSGNCEGVKMGSIDAVRHVNRPLVNPTVNTNGTLITFGCNIDSTEYLEYTPEEGALIYDRQGNYRSVELIEGKLVVPKGEFTAELTDSSDAIAHGRAILTFGVYGETIS